MMTAESFAACLRAACGVCPGDHVLAAVSGGADSVALLCLLCEVREALHISVSCAHVEHGIRGEVSLEDMAFVRTLCMQKQVPFCCEQVDVPGYAAEYGCGMEEAARILRYEALERMAQRVGAAHIALAHHAQDQAETVLLHAARGSDLRGLCAMRHRRGNIIRPLLDHSPQALRGYLEKRGQSWREDESNLDVAYARNRIRREAMPALEAAYPGAVEALCRLACAAQRDEAHFTALLDGLALGRIPLVDGVMLERGALEALDDALLSRAIVREMQRAGLMVQSAEAIARIADAVRSGQEATVNLAGGAHAYISGKSVCMIRHDMALPDTALALCGQTKTPFGVFTVRKAEAGEHGDGIACQAFDATMLEGCVVTGRRVGDGMVPFGRHQMVKLKKLMIDAGVERPIRNSLPVLRKGDMILWAVGLRPSAYCSACGGERLMVEYKRNT